jgi:hypothetical protein
MLSTTPDATSTDARDKLQVLLEQLLTRGQGDGGLISSMLGSMGPLVRMYLGKADAASTGDFCAWLAAALTMCSTEAFTVEQLNRWLGGDESAGPAALQKPVPTDEPEPGA